MGAQFIQMGNKKIFSQVPAVIILEERHYIHRVYYSKKIKVVSWLLKAFLVWEGFYFSTNSNAGLSHSYK